MKYEFFKKHFHFPFLLLAEVILASPSDNPLLQKGWAALVKDDETVAFNYFWQAFENAKKKKTPKTKQKHFYI